MTRVPQAEYIKATLRTRFGSLKAFESSRGLPIASARDALRGRSVHQAMAAIAAELNQPLEIVFPHASTSKPKGPTRKVRVTADEQARRDRRASFLSAFRRMSTAERRAVLIVIAREFDPATGADRKTNGGAK